MSKTEEKEERMENPIREINAMLGCSRRRRYYSPREAHERYERRKEEEIQKHIANCREKECHIKSQSANPDNNLNSSNRDNVLVTAGIDRIIPVMI